jgi:hypothetical protein
VVSAPVCANDVGVDALMVWISCTESSSGTVPTSSSGSFDLLRGCNFNCRCGGGYWLWLQLSCWRCMGVVAALKSCRGTASGFAFTVVVVVCFSMHGSVATKCRSECQGEYDDACED